jgi:hypothetical protein
MNHHVRDLEKLKKEPTDFARFLHLYTTEQKGYIERKLQPILQEKSS